MKKRVVSVCLLVFMLVLAFPVTAGAASMADVPKSIGAPVNVGISAEANEGVFDWFQFGFSGDKNVRKFGELDASGDFKELGLGSLGIDVQIDYKYNESGKWHYDSSWDETGNAPYEMLVYDVLNMDSGDTSINGENLDPVVSNMDQLKNNTYYFRLRYVLSYFNDESGEGTTLVSPWSETVAMGKAAVQEKVTKVDPPVLKNAELKKNDKGLPYIELTVAIPESVKALNNGEGSVCQYTSVRINGQSWSESGTSAGLLQEVIQVNPEDEGGIDNIDIKAASLDVRVRFGYSSQYTGDKEVYSPYSNLITIGTPAFKNASKWATAELNKAAEYGFITDKIKDNMSGPITREEFAELAIKLYEKYTGEAAAYKDKSAFVDTDNSEIFKAFDLKIVNGTDPAKKLFTPKALTTREQVAAMLYRAVQAIKPNADLSTAGAPNFSDMKQVSKYAVDNVKFMAKMGFIQGSNGKFDPKGNCTREQAVLIAVRVYEKYAGK